MVPAVFLKRLLFTILCPIALLIVGHAIGQTPINPTTWTGQGTSASGPSAFTTLPASTLPGVAVVNVSQWNRDAALTNTTAGGCYNSSNWQLGGSLGTAMASNADVYFTITNSSTTELQITQLYIMSQVSATGPTNAQLRYTVGSTSGNFGIPISTAHSASPENWTLDGNVCVGPGQTVTFRLYAWGGGNPAGTLRINNGTAITAGFANPVTVTASNNSPICAGDTIKFAGGAGGGIGPYTYNWSGPLGFSSTLLNPIITPAVAGSVGTYTLTVTDALNCSTLDGTGNTVVSLNPPLGAITGMLTTCPGSTTALSSTTIGGVWASSDVSVATIDPTGVVTGVVAGTTNITYTASTGCFTTQVITVNPLPPAITGTAFVCTGLTITLSDASPGGTWSSGDATIAPVDASGVVTGLSNGTADIIYTATTGCTATRVVTVTALPSAITGTLTLCPGTTTTLSNSTPGGTWSSANTLIATANAGTGVITGVAAGTTTITYLVGASCLATTTITVNPLPGAITGTRVVCSGLTAILNNATPGGTWSSGSIATATVGSISGIVTGASGGTVTISYTLIATGCYATATVTVNPLPTAISGGPAVCVGSSVALGNTSAGGTWSSSNTIVATIGSGTGVISGLVAGTTVITYKLSTGCIMTRIETVNPLPALITGPGIVCANGGTITLSDATAGGAWSSSDPTIATASPVTGVITGVVAGSVTITYTLGTGCTAIKGVSVNPAPPALVTPLGDTSVCPGSAVVLTANPGTGLTYQWFVGGVAISGSVGLTYIATASGSYQIRTINSLGCPSFSTPVLVTIDTPVAIISTASGIFSTCSGVPISLDANTGTGLTYEWQLDGVSIAGATNSSYVTSTPGQYSVFVSNSTGCTASDTVELTVYPDPTPAVTLSGPAQFCQGGSVVMTTTSISATGYQWCNASGPIAGATSSWYTATVAGNYFVTATNTFGCSASSSSISVVVYPLPSVGIMPGGSLTVCAPATVTLNASSGAGYTYKWYRGGALIPGATNVSFIATVSGHYRVKITTANGCSDMTHADTVVTIISSPTVIAVTSASFCWGSNAMLATSVSGGAGLLYEWMLNGTPIAGATSATYTTTVAGNYSVKITAPGSCTITAASLAVHENPLPNPVVTYNSATRMLQTQNYFIAYQWYKDLVIIPGATSNICVATTSGAYKVDVTDTNGCHSFSTAFPVSMPGGVNGVNGVIAAEDIAVYPNPSADVVHIGAPFAVSVELKSIDGRTVIARGAATSTVDLADVSTGVYLLLIFDVNGTLIKTEKVTKL
jgi:uncharacterized protein YjdB